MTWFKVDDGLWGHRKWVALTGKPGARALWVTAGSWCAANLTDGWVPPHMLPILGAKRTDADALVEVELWHVAPQGGWVFHEWGEPGRQPSRADVEARRADARDRMQRAREAKSSREHNANVRANTTRTFARTSRELRAKFESCSHNPDPTRPDPTQTNPPTPSASSPPPAVASATLTAEPTNTGVPDQSLHQQPPAAHDGSAAPAAGPKAVRRGTRVPDDFQATDAMLTWVRAHCPDVPAAEHERFMDYWRAVPGAKGVKLDWVATWRNWMRGAQDDIRKGRRPAAGPRRSTTDDRVAAGLALAAKYDAEDGTATIHQLPIGGTA